MSKEEIAKEIIRIIFDYNTSREIGSADKAKKLFLDLFDRQTKELQEKLNQAIFVNENIRSLFNNEIELRAETQKELDETAHKLEGYIEHNKQLQSKIDELSKDNEWISVDEQKPFNAGLYLCHTNDEQTMVCFLSTNGWWSKVPDASFYGDMGNKIVINSKEVEREVTHWKPLPKAPTNKSIND